MTHTGNTRFDLSGRVAVVTGSGRGLGGAGAMALAQAGAKVVVAARTIEECEETATIIRELGGEALALCVDAADWSACDKLAASVERLGSVDIALFAAGVFDMHAAEEATQHEWHRTINVNLTGAFNSVQIVGRLDNRGVFERENRCISESACVQRIEG